MATEKYNLRYVGTYITKGAYEFEAAAPLDTRSVVPNLKCLISATVWENNAEYIYTGLPVYVESTQEYYMMVDRTALQTHLYPDSELRSMEDDTVKANVKTCWEKLAFASDVDAKVKQLGPVFIFKGVADSLSPDERVITRHKVSYTPHNESEAIELTCLGFERGFPDEYYAWGTVDASNNITTYFYSAEPSVVVGTTQYKRTSEDVSIFYVDETERTGIRYYFDGCVANQDASASASSLDVSMWKFTDEADMSHIYCVAPPVTGDDPTEQKESPDEDLTNVTFYLDPDTSEPVYDILDIDHFDAVVFEEMSPSEAGTINNTSAAESIVASNNNNGWVFQIGEEEYASNGLIWVQLGSPDNDWIII